MKRVEPGRHLCSVTLSPLSPVYRQFLPFCFLTIRSIHFTFPPSLPGFQLLSPVWAPPVDSCVEVPKTAPFSDSLEGTPRTQHVIILSAVMYGCQGIQSKIGQAESNGMKSRGSQGQAPKSPLSGTQVGRT